MESTNDEQVAQRIQRTEKQLEEFRLKLERMKAENVAKTAEFTALESSMPNLKEALGTKELDLKNLKEFLAATEQDFKDATSDYNRKKNRIKALKKQIAENVESISTSSNLYDSLSYYKQVLSGENKNAPPPKKRMASSGLEENKSPPKKRAIVPKIEISEVVNPPKETRPPDVETATDLSAVKKSPPKQRDTDGDVATTSSEVKKSPREKRPSDTVTENSDEEKYTPRTRTPRPTVEVFMEKTDEPDFETEGSGSSGGGDIAAESTVDHERRIKQRIKYMLNLGRNSSTPEHEMSQALRNAERLLRKHNLNKAEILEMEDNPDLIETDVVKVTLRSVKTKQKVPLMEWYYRLSEALALNFNVKYYYNNSDESYFVFYGLKHNSQMAAYMYQSVFAQIHILSKLYKPDESNPEVRKVMEEASTKGAFTRQMRLSYALGICIKLIQNVEKEQKIREERMKARRDLFANRMEKAIKRGTERIPRHAVEGEDGRTVSELSRETESENEYDEGKRIGINGEERENKKEHVLIIMEKNAPLIALKRKGIDIETTCQRSTADVLSVAVKDGKVDARKINLNRREISDK